MESRSGAFNPARATDESLKFVYSDCLSAIAALPAGYKTEHYLSLARAIEQEQNARAAKRTWRRVLREHLTDPLTVQPVRSRWHVKGRNGNGYERDRWRSAAWMLASYRLNPALLGYSQAA